MQVFVFEPVYAKVSSKLLLHIHYFGVLLHVILRTTRATPKGMPFMILCWSAVSEEDIGVTPVEAEPSSLHIPFHFVRCQQKGSQTKWCQTWM